LVGTTSKRDRKGGTGGRCYSIPRRRTKRKGDRKGQNEEMRGSVPKSVPRSGVKRKNNTAGKVSINSEAAGGQGGWKKRK